MTEKHLIIGDPSDTSLCTVRPDCGNGMVYAYQRDASGRWVFMQEVRPAALAPYFGFGGSVDLDGDRLIVGSPGPGAGGGLGAAYTFEYDGEQWNEAAELRGTMAIQGFGRPVAIYGDTALVNGLGGYFYVYRFNGEEWSWLETYQSPDSHGESSGFGTALDINDERVVIGANFERIIAPNGGAVYVYLRQPDGRLELEQKLVAPDVLRGPRFGSSVSLDGEQLAVGAELGRRTATAQGVVYMHEFVDGRWELRQELVVDDPAEIDRLGRDVDLSGNQLAAGAPTRQMPDRTGAAFLFERDATGHWAQSAAFLPDAWQVDFGSQVGLNAGNFVVGAPRTFVDDVQHGSVSVFDLDCEICEPDLDTDGTLTIFDFLMFFNLFDAGDHAADLDADGALTIFDFLAFQAAFDTGCK